MKHMLGMSVFSLVALCSAVVPAHAQTARTGGSAPANAAQLQQLQQLASERTALQAENAKLKAELEALRKEQTSAKQSKSAAEQRSQASAAAALARSNSETERLQADLARERERMQELVARFRETATTLRDVETERAAVKQSLVQRDQELKVCVERNQALYKLNQEVLTKFEDQGFWSALARKEPFTQLKRVQLENLIDGYRSSAQDQVVAPAARPASAPSPIVN
jgi:predicted RNase H-like nuclease (RuvC/YqgF family)